MNAKVYDLSGAEKGEIALPAVFNTPYRPDVIKKVVLAMQANRRQAYGVDALAGKRTSAHYHGARGIRNTMMNREMSRMPRIHGSSPGQNFRAAFVPQAVGGRKAHPPKPEKVWKQKINKKEKELATRSAIAATISEELVSGRGHKFELPLPLVVSDEIVGIRKTKQLVDVLKSLKLESELSRAQKKKVRAGKGKMRGRKYKTKTSILIVVHDKIMKVSIPGVDVSRVEELNPEILAPGCMPGRLVLWTESAIKKLGELFK